MAAAPLESSSVPHSAALSLDTSRSHSELMEDTDSQSTRKRPRLDSGNHLHESMSTSTCTSASSEDQDRLVNGSLVAASPPGSPGTPALQRPSGRVTINMKSPLLPKQSAQSCPQHNESVDATGTDDSNVQQPRTNTNASHQGRDPIGMATQTTTAISITSSPAQSPEIEVAEVEDMDQDPSTSNWRSLEDALRAPDEPDVVGIHEEIALADSFPRFHRNLDLREAVEYIAEMIEKGHAHDVTIFGAVKHWFDLCLNNLDQISYETVVDDRELWEELPTVVDSLLKRQADFQPDEGQGPWQCVEAFCVAFAQIALQMIRIDTATLEHFAEDGDAAPDLTSKKYLPSLGWILQIHIIPFFRMMERAYGSEIANLVSRINDQITQPPINAIQYLSEFADRLLKTLPQAPLLAQTLIFVLTIVHNMVESGIERKRFHADENVCSSPALMDTLELAYSLFRPIDLTYQSFISKRSSWITSENSESILRYIGFTYQNIALLDHQFAVQIAQDLGIELPETAKPEEYPQIIFLGWKFQVLKKHITDGRMELRVHGIEAMQMDLVSVWRQHIQGNPAGINYPIIQYLVKFLRDNKIVEYIVGVDSHPQLISRSGNIVGFLVVTSTYTNRDTDTIWNTVTESQDPRTVSGVLGMLTRTFAMHQSTSTALHYLCTKLIELPLSRFDTRMIEYCDQLLTTLREKQMERMRHEALDYIHVDVVPLRLCVRLLREATAVEDFSVEQRTLLQKFATKQLPLLLSLGLNDVDKMEMYKQCIQDISEMNEFTVGSIQALHALIPPYDTQDIRRLALDFDFTRLIVTELAHAVDACCPEFADSSFRNGLASRIQLLHRVVEKVPDTITPDLSEILWNSIFTSEKIGEQDRNLAWDVLSKVASRCGRRNSFLERLMNEYLPHVAPGDFTLDILAFAEQAVSYEIRFDPPSLAKENEVILIPGMDRIWHFILTAPSGTIEMKATNFAIDTYLDHPLIRRAPRSAAEATHISLVDRCVGQLTAAATKLKSFSDGTTSGEDEPMVIVPSDGEVRAEELRFSRSLLFLRQLLQGLRTRPQYTPPQGSPPSLPLKEDEVKGDLIELSYQAFSGSSQTGIRTLRIGDLATASDLAEKLVRLTGFSRSSTISGGQRLDLLSSPNLTLRELRLARSGLLLVRKHPDAFEISVAGRRQSLTLVDSEVLKHFNDLYELLGLEERLSKEIFDFLVVFPPQQRVRDFVRSPETTEEEMFPLEKPYKLLYSINSLITCLREEVLEVNPNQEFISHSIQTLVAFLTRPEMSETLEDSPLKLRFACNFIECLQLALTAKSTPDNSEPSFSNPTGLATQLLALISLGQKLPATHLSELDIQKLISNSFAVSIEASMHDNRVWDALKQSTEIQSLVFKLLLDEPRQSIRKGVAEIIFTICGTSPSQKQSLKGINAKNMTPTARHPTPTTVDIVATLWKSITALFPKTLKFALSSQEFFEVALVVFQTVASWSPGDVVFGEYLRHWGNILLSHRTREFVGREPVDYIVLGFTHLLKMCLELSNSTTAIMNAGILMERLFTTYLFPDLSHRTEHHVIQPNIPVMHNLTRQEIYNVLILLCEDPANCGRMLELLKDIIPQDYTYEPNWVFDRYKTIRSPEGYAGLKNLSNTCYLNSLLTQLFMNVDFRKFMLGVQVTDMDSAQRLLAETKKVFGYMQNTWQKSVDTHPAVDTIRTYDNEPIDINVQMDVDEFYNLLFDRWESQILAPEDKKLFRSFYGGQLVQQIKSKECSHISERLEPFSAIQCDIKGKSCLEDSLRAYVEGEIMQGDNKYSCTSCGRHVDAVKRACLKDIPDNLIFHLKRFDFDVISMTRSKINDEFQFPASLDMAPFKVEYLSNSATPIAPDIFELVGVLVHSGTAESGHYYSYVKERPTAADSDGSWVEFNDSDVSRFDPSKIPDQCFGGMNDPLHGPGLGQVRFNKVWNAYMLFYQRVSGMRTAKAVYNPSPGDSPVSVPLPLGLGNHIAMENEVFIRTFCLLDPYHAYFVRALLEQSRRIAAMGESEPMRLQMPAIPIALDNLDQLISRSKELPEHDMFIVELGRAINDSPQCALKILQWTTKRPLGIRNLLLKSPNATVRSNFCRLLISALSRLHGRVADRSLMPDELSNCRREFTEMLDSVVTTLERLWAIIHLHARAWDDYFELLLGIANLGPAQAEVLLDHGFMLKCLEIVWLDREDSKKLKRQYANYYRLVEKGRRYSQFKLVELLYVLLAHTDLTLPASSEDQPRHCHHGRYSLTNTEVEFVRPIGRNKDLVLLKKILEQQSNPQVSRKITSIFLDAEPEFGLTEPICRVLEEGLRVAPADLCIPFLEATLVFCQFSTDIERISGLIDYVAKGVDSINNSGGREHLSFFQSLVATQNERLGKEQFWFGALVVERIPDWAPTLLHYPEKGVRNNTFDFLRQLLFSKEHEELPEDFRQFYNKIARDLAQTCVEKLRRTYLMRSGPQSSVDSRMIETITLVITHCMEVYFDESESDEDREFFQQATAVIGALEHLTVEMPEELVSGSDFPSDGWDDNSMMGSDSDVVLPGSP